MNNLTLTLSTLADATNSDADRKSLLAVGVAVRDNNRAGLSKALVNLETSVRETVPGHVWDELTELSE